MRESEFRVNNLVDPADNDLLEAWSFPIVGPAPEENIAPEPQNFPDILTYLTTSYEEAIAEYEALLDKHVSDEMKSNTNEATERQGTFGVRT